MNDWSEDNFLERLTPQLRKKADGATGPCPDAETLLAVMEGAASEQERNTVNEHLSRCAACAELRSRLLSFESTSPSEPEVAWNQAETRLDNWMEGFLRFEAAHSHVPKVGKPSQRAFGWKSISGLFTRRKSAWAWGVALALVLIEGAPLLLKYGQQLLSPVQVAVITSKQPSISHPVSGANPSEKGTEKPSVTSRAEGLPRSANNVPREAESPNPTKARVPGAPLATTVPADRNLPTETAEVRVPPAAPAPPNLPTLQLYPDGRVATIRTMGMTINYRFDGGRTIASEQNQRTLVSTGPHSGYIERQYVSREGQTYYQRTYLVGGRTYTKLYRGFEYHGVRYDCYVRARLFSPAFYEWAFNPWTAPIHYNWGWGSAPWFYGGYFAPAPYYPSAMVWLTDYLLEANLRAAYEAALEAQTPLADRSEGPPPGNPETTIQPIVSPGVKQVIANEVEQQLRGERAADSNPPAKPSSAQVPDALNPAERLFVVSSNLSVVMVGGQECELRPVDAIARIDATAGNDNKVRVIVMSSRQNDCSVGAIPRVAVDDLQEMRNSFQEELDSGLRMLAQKSGTGGLPKAPDTGVPNGEVPFPPPDRGVADQLVALQVQADKAEYDAANRIQNSGDLKGALALFQALAVKAGPVQSQAQEREHKLRN